jgi:hypothetical protein
VRTLLSLLGLVTLFGCSDRGTVSVPDVTATNAFTLNSRGGSISGLTLHVRGHLNGTGYIHAANWETQALSGTIDWKIYHDWFYKSCTLEYRPEGVHAGSVTIDYEFH